MIKLGQNIANETRELHQIRNEQESTQKKKCGEMEKVCSLQFLF